MPELARGEGGDAVSTGHACDTSTVTDACSGNVKVNGKGVVRVGDAVAVHLYPSGPCVPHAPSMDAALCSSTVFANGLRVAYKGSKYGGDHPIVSGSPTVNVGV